MLDQCGGDCEGYAEGGSGLLQKGKEEVTVYGEAVADILRRTTDAFVQNDQRLAHTVEPLEEVIDELNKVVKKHHMKRRKGKCTIEMGLMLSDLAMNYERVADHCSNIAVYMMQVKDSQLEEHSFTEQLDAKESGGVCALAGRVRQEISAIKAAEDESIWQRFIL